MWLEALKIVFLIVAAWFALIGWTAFRPAAAPRN